jgi:[acyl-carrier-protein] S-malonyltransferase
VSPEDIRAALVKQLYSPVRWVETVQQIEQSGVTRVAEMGPGKVLLGLNKRIVTAAACDSVFDVASLDAALQATQ